MKTKLYELYERKQKSAEIGIEKMKVCKENFEVIKRKYSGFIFNEEGLMVIEDIAEQYSNYRNSVIANGGDVSGLPKKLKLSWAKELK